MLRSVFLVLIMKVLVFLSLVTLSTARMSYVLPAGYLEILGGDPNPSFSCDNRPYGYYADVDNACALFHVCQPFINEETGEFEEIAHFTFLCGNQTIFSQNSLTCDHPEFAFPCDQAPTLYDISNADFGKIPEPSNF